MKKINLLYVIHTMNNGGAETLAIRLAEKLDADKFNVMVCSLSDQGPLRRLMMEKNIHFVSLGTKGGKDFRLIWKLRRTILGHNTDIIHTHNQGPLLYVYLTNLFCRNLILVHTEHIDVSKELSYSFKDHLHNKLMYRALTGFVSIAQHLTDYFCSQYDLSGVNVRTIHNSVEIKDLPSSPIRYLRKELKIADDTPLIGNVSALRPQKDHHTLIRAMEIAIEKVPEAVLAIVGEGECEDELKHLVDQLHLKNNIKFIGYRSDISGLLPQFDLFVLSSLYEGLPLCILEAMAAGIPIVATDVNGTNELVRHGVTGLLTPVKDADKIAEAILSVLLDLSAAREMGRKARKLVEEEYNLDKMVKEYEGYYGHLSRS